MDAKTAMEIFNKAKLDGIDALEKCAPEPMTVCDGNREYHVPQGTCGFAWVRIKARGKAAGFISALKKLGLASADVNDFSRDVELKKSDSGGYLFWVHEGGQSYEKKRAYAHAMAGSLRGSGIECRAGSRLD